MILITGLLEIEPTERLSSIELHKWLRPFSKEIIAFRDFTFNIPEKSVSGTNTLLKIKKQNSVSVNESPSNQNNVVFTNKNIPQLKSRLTHALIIP